MRVTGVITNHAPDATDQCIPHNRGLSRATFLSVTKRTTLKIRSTDTMKQREVCQWKTQLPVSSDTDFEDKHLEGEAEEISRLMEASKVLENPEIEEDTAF
ncbi:hypothetical protein NDU88_008644 [Pleurodeles waltl]|uniref:Uncharacterized protein n=1 Tax=Pleurodeles waltl TaxID=8319 RepID=A0AAV7QV69_PLEWA|nr:hypothetical protein NDU88_008644 [Pleurodeles waltl]